jgi:hypothetical protein
LAVLAHRFSLHSRTENLVEVLSSRKEPGSRIGIHFANAEAFGCVHHSCLQGLVKVFDFPMCAFTLAKEFWTFLIVSP